ASARIHLDGRLARPLHSAVRLCRLLRRTPRQQRHRHEPPSHPPKIISTAGKIETPAAYSKPPTVLRQWNVKDTREARPCPSPRELLARDAHHVMRAAEEPCPSPSVRSCGFVLGCVTQPWHGVEPGWIAVLALGTLALTGVVNAETLRSVNWSFVLLFGTLASMAAVFAVARVDRWMAAVVSASVQGLASAPIVFVAALTAVCFAVSLVLRWQAAAPLLTLALAPAPAAAGISPFVVGLVTLIACNGFFLPYQSTTYLA